MQAQTKFGLHVNWLSKLIIKIKNAPQIISKFPKANFYEIPFSIVRAAFCVQVDKPSESTERF
jgi:hypothetical protein